MENIKLSDIYNTEIRYSDEWEVQTPNGFQSFSSVKRITQSECIRLIVNINNTEKELISSLNHKYKTELGEFVNAKQLKSGDVLKGNGVVISVQLISNEPIDLYDLMDVDNGNEYYTEDIISHNCAFIQKIDDLWASVQPTLSTGGKAILLSTPNGLGNLFHKVWVRGETKENGFNTIRLPWTVHPERDQKWRDQQTAELGHDKASQECDCLLGDTYVTIKHKETNEVSIVTLSELERMLCLQV